MIFLLLAWTAWDKEDHKMTEAFKSLGVPQPNGSPQNVLHTLERFVNVLYGAKDCSSAAAARQHLFGTLGKSLQFIPPTFGALEQHAHRAAYQAGQIWGRSLNKCWDDLPSPDGWGWKITDRRWVPHWSNLDDIWKSCRDLSVCGCTTGCGTKRCKCQRLGVSCALSCKKCRGACENSK